MNFEKWFSTAHPEIPVASAHAVLKLTGEGATLPFIARYRKEQTGNLDEVAIQHVIDGKEMWDAVLKRQAFMLGEIEAQKKLTPELKDRILATFQMEVLEDIYLPYKQKRKTKAALAKEAGLQPLADWIWNCGHGIDNPQEGQTLELWAFTFRNEEKGINDANAAIEGAQDILIERLSEIQELRALVRENVFKKGHLRTNKAEKAKQNSKYMKYFDYSEPVESLVLPQNSHRYLAIRRGWMEEELSLSIGGSLQDEEFAIRMVKAFEAAACSGPGAPGAAVLLKAANLALKAHVLPAIEREAHKALKDVADEIAIRVFAENVRKLLLASPYGPKAVLGIDPGIRTGCKVAMVDSSGKFLANSVFKLQNDDDKAHAKQLLQKILTSVEVSAVAVGNGTAGRETESFLRATFKELSITVPVVMVNEAGASVYSASETARDEFPELDVTVRGAISIARRLQDPLAELVKIDPKSIGVGQYQHDVAPNALKKSLEIVVDLCVNSVGVNLNTASHPLLSHVSGIGPALAKAIVAHRADKGLFKSRIQLLEIPHFSSKAFEQSAGFLRIPEGENPLDNTGVHPERYPLLEGVAKRLNKDIRELMGAGVAVVKEDKQLAEEIGPFTFKDIVTELEKPGRDPRDTFVPFQYRDDVFEVKDLKPAMSLPGIVTNVTNFGAFVDVGVHQDGLVHLSQLSDKFVKDPREVVSPGDRVTVRVLEVNLEKNQISLSMKSPADARPRPNPRERREGGGRPPRGPRPPRPNQDRNQQQQQGAQQGGGGGQGGQQGRPQRPQKPQRVPQRPGFSYNPFAALAGLKDVAKKPPAKE